MKLTYSFIIPVYNRPDEIRELLQSMCALEGNIPFEVVIVEDGSDRDAASEVEAFNDRLNITYLTKPNTGPGDSRNYGMKRAAGNYFIILDSDCLLPPQYLLEVQKALNQTYVDCFGGPDAAHASFTNLQKAVNFAMTSVITTGGIRGNKRSVGKFQPRSFNMGLSKKAFEATGGFGTIHPGEDPDLTIRVWNSGFDTVLIPNAFVFHKRRISWKGFYHQVRKFGLTRPILNSWHPQTAKLTYWFPTAFAAGALTALLMFTAGYPQLFILFAGYLVAVFAGALIAERSLPVAFLAVPAVLIQFFGYGIAFVRSQILINFLKKDPKKVFPNLFFE